MAVATKFVDTPFGFTTIKMGGLEIYCGKVRIKGIEFRPDRAYLRVKYHKGYCIISFEVTDKLIANDLYRVVGSLCREVAQSKLNEKWKWLNS